MQRVYTENNKEKQLLSFTSSCEQWHTKMGVKYRILIRIQLLQLVLCEDVVIVTVYAKSITKKSNCCHLRQVVNSGTQKWVKNIEF